MNISLGFCPTPCHPPNLVLDAPDQLPMASRIRNTYSTRNLTFENWSISKWTRAEDRIEVTRATLKIRRAWIDSENFIKPQDLS